MRIKFNRLRFLSAALANTYQQAKVRMERSWFGCHYRNILRDITNYDHYCAAHPEFENNVTKMTAQRIEEIYHRCLADNDFL